MNIFDNCIVLYDPNKEDAARVYFSQICKGLSKEQKTLPTQYRYNQEGSQICSLINKLEEYYIWKCETEIFETRGSEILSIFGRDKFNLIDLGAGDATKTKILLKKAVSEGYNFEYIPLDISEDSNRTLCRTLKQLIPNIQLTVLTSLFEQGIEWVQKNRNEKNVYFLVGGTLGNLPPQDCQKFVDFLQLQLKKDDMLMIGIDLMKDPAVIQKAYSNDSGLEQKFIMNNLKRIKKEFRAEIDIGSFYPHSYFDPYTRCEYGCLISKANQVMKINLNEKEVASFNFKAGEVTRVSQSKKWLPNELDLLLKSRGFEKVTNIYDSQDFFGEFFYRKA